MLVADNLLERGDGDGRLYDWFAVRREGRLARRDFSRADHRLSVHRLWLDCRDRRARRWRRQRRARRRCRDLSETGNHPRLRDLAALAVLAAHAQSRLSRVCRAARTLSFSAGLALFSGYRRALGRRLFTRHPGS